MAEDRDTGVLSTAKKTANAIKEFGSRLTRKKFVDTDVMETNLRRCLNTADITMLAIGHMIGSGVYVLTATVAKNMAGPAIVLAFLFSGFASFLAALCYAELGVRYPRSGSAYSYTYLALGELWAFLVGWNVALEHVIGAAAISRACSAYIDSLAGGVISNATENAMGAIHVPFIAERLDFLAFGILILFTVCLSFGVRMTSHLNNVFSVANLVVIVTIICVGAYFADTSNWTNPATGGFMPFGWSGVLAASASCFYAYVGFDSIASSGEEARDPQKSIPRATMISMGIATTTYVAVATVLTLMVNYQDIHDDSGLPDALAAHGAHWAKIVVIVGAVSGMATGIIGSLFALTRVIYVMADDGLLFAFCSNVNTKTKIPLGAMYIFASLSALMTLTLDINTLVEVMSIGTLFAYLVVSASVIILRYRPNLCPKDDSQELSSIGSSTEKIEDIGAGEFKARFQMLRTYLDWWPGRLVTMSVLCFVIFTFLTCGFVTGCSSSIANGSWWSIIILVVLLFCTISCFVIITLHQQSTAPLRYKVPLVPLIPALSIVVNAVLIVNLQAATWLRLLIWVAVGLSMYLSYGLGHSKLDATSPKSTLLKPGASQLPTWGSLEREPSFDAAHKTEHSTDKGKHPIQSSLSKEFLVDNVDTSP
ncbi:cationic amino acid transporter 4-like [Argiope bruennichi]|uniref:Cationic amino acid transporter 4 like protein n=1 Tax=Argiope bruennichi TaxID=94029 RepID=A0A8T0FQJ9_ARGBR|nr:cationic amino acid transporter 4-like [Argiope bruennichi]KAF8793457.1 Cationic amino acid transporter 4 like protein [Argiope bruennichi]